MSKNKLQKFAQMATFDNVYECTAKSINSEGEPLSIAGCWHERFFHNTNPIVLELGCGRGEYTVGLARLCPEKNFIGVDIKGARMWAGAKQATEEKISNAAFLRTNIEYIERFFAPSEVSEIWITFPDPQMKKATKRLTSSFFMQRYKNILAAGGLIHLKTDSPFLYQYTLEMIKANHFTLEYETDDLYGQSMQAPAVATQIQTHYEHQWLERGMSIKLLSFRLPYQEQYIEPEVDIEKDTYRSYGRNYNTNHHVSSTNH